VERLLSRILSDAPHPVLAIGRDLDALLPDLERALGSGEGIETIALEADQPRFEIQAEEGSFNTVVLHRTLGLLEDAELMRLLRECRRVLADGGRVAICDRLFPVDRVLAGGKRTLLRRFGVRRTSTEVYALLESAGFWDCLVLRRGTFDRAVLIKGEKVLQRAELARHPTLNTNPTFRLIK
jgi:SAM-dependent methyltransferase